MITFFSKISKDLADDMDKRWEKFVSQKESTILVKEIKTSEAEELKNENQTPSSSGQAKKIEKSPENTCKEIPKKEDKFSRDPKESRLKWIQRNLRGIQSHEQYNTFLTKACQMIKADAESMNLEIVRMTLDPNPKLSGRPCWFYQFNGSSIKKCHYDFIHPSKPFRELFKILEYSKKHFEILLFMNVCQLCWLLRKSGVEHPFYSCEMVMELDLHEEDPERDNMVTMRPKMTKNDEDEKEKDAVKTEENEKEPKGDDEDDFHCDVKYIDDKISIHSRLGPKLHDF